MAVARPTPPDGKVECARLRGGHGLYDLGALRWRVSAYGIAVRDGRVLLGRSAFTGKWDIPGGGIEPWEPLVEGMVREFTEETGVRPEPGDLLHFGESFFAIFDHPFHSLRYYFRVSVPEGTDFVPQTQEVRSFAWVDLAAEPAGEFAPGDVAVLQKALGR